jgi:uncharacterized protein (DUF433 family)
MKEPVVSRDPNVMGGTAVFHGTRVPVQTLLDYLEPVNPSMISSKDFPRSREIRLSPF